MTNTANPYRVIQANLEDVNHQKIVLQMVHSFAQDTMANGQGLPTETQGRLIEGLRRHPAKLIFIAFQEHRAVGISICFLGFSTFMAKPLVNIHDFYVKKDFRRKGIGKLLLQAVENTARELGCGKLTLEVEEHNQKALALYHSFGFDKVEYSAEAGMVLFRQKML